MEPLTLGLVGRNGQQNGPEQQPLDLAINFLEVVRVKERQKKEVMGVVQEGQPRRRRQWRLPREC